MYQFFKDYFNFSHEEDGYTMSKVNGVVKISKIERIVLIIISYIIAILSPLIFLTSLEWYQNLFLWVMIISFPITIIFIFDFRIFKIIRLYIYSKSSNRNKRIIYETYMKDDNQKLFLKVFQNYKKKRINIDKSFLRYRADCSFKNIKMCIIVKPCVVIIKINKYKETIKNNKNDLLTILEFVNEKLKNIYLN